MDLDRLRPSVSVVQFAYTRACKPKFLVQAKSQISTEGWLCEFARLGSISNVANSILTSRLRLLCAPRSFRKGQENRRREMSSTKGLKEAEVSMKNIREYMASFQLYIDAKNSAFPAYKQAKVSYRHSNCPICLSAHFLISAGLCLWR